MICARCLRRAAAQPATSIPRPWAASMSPSGKVRPISTSLPRREPQQISSNTTQASNPSPPGNPALFTSAAQPFSSRGTISPSTAATPTTPSQPPAAPRSSVVAGTPLRGLNYFKNKDDPLALEDHEYPDWLWTVLDKKETSAQGKEGMDPRLFAKSARSRRMANKRAKKAELERSQGPELQIPIYEQSVDLPPEAGARHQLTKGMREKRRKDIKETNFLKGMR